MNKAIFLDRDGTINEDVGYNCSAEKLIFIPRALGALKALQRDYLLFIVTNQSGIGKGFFTEKEFLDFNRYFLNRLEAEGVSIKKLYYCPHKKEDNCPCYKPKTFFLDQARTEFNIDLAGSWVVGDHPSDIEMADRAGARPVYLLTGHGAKHKNELKNPVTTPIVCDLYEAMLLICSVVTGGIAGNKKVN